MYCEKCGAKLDDDSKFCTQCGAKLTASPAANQNNTAELHQSEPAPIAETTTAAPKRADNPQEEQTSKKKKAGKEKEMPAVGKVKTDIGSILLIVMTCTLLLPYLLKTAALYARKAPLSVPMVIGCEAAAFIVAGLILLLAARRYSGKMAAGKIVQFLGAYAGTRTLLPIMELFYEPGSAIKNIILLAVCAAVAMLAATLMLNALIGLFVKNEMAVKGGKLLSWLFILLALASELLVVLIAMVIGMEDSFFSTGAGKLMTALFAAVGMKAAIERLLKKQTETENTEKGGVFGPAASLILAALALLVSVIQNSPLSVKALAEEDVEGYFVQAEWYLGRKDMAMAVQSFDQAARHAYAWENTSQGANFSMNQEHDTTLEYLRFVTSSPQEQYIFMSTKLPAQEIERFAPIMLNSYRKESENRELDEKYQQHQKEVLALCAARECFTKRYPGREEFAENEELLEGLSEAGSAADAHYEMARILDRYQKSESDKSIIVWDMLVCAEKYPEDMALQYIAASLGSSFLYDSQYHYDETGEAILRYHELWMKQNEKTADQNELYNEYMDCASMLSAVKQYDQALLMMNQAQEIQPENLTLMLQAAAAYLDNEEFEKSFSIAEEICRKTKDDATALWIYCVSALRSGKEEKSIEAASALADLLLTAEGEEALNADAFLMNCVHYLGLNDHTEWTRYQYRVFDGGNTEEAYAKLFHANPFLEDYVSAIYWGQQEGKWEEALTYAERCLEKKPDSAQLHYLKGMILFSLSRVEEAETEYLKADELLPNDASILFALANTYDRLEDYETAFRYCSRAVAMFPDGANHSSDWYGVSYHARILYDALKSHLEQEGN